MTVDGENIGSVDPQSLRTFYHEAARASRLIANIQDQNNVFNDVAASEEQRMDSAQRQARTVRRLGGLSFELGVEEILQQRAELEGELVKHQSTYDDLVRQLTAKYDLLIKMFPSRAEQFRSRREAIMSELPENEEAQLQSAFIAELQDELQRLNEAIAVIEKPWPLPLAWYESREQQTDQEEIATQETVTAELEEAVEEAAEDIISEQEYEEALTLGEVREAFLNYYRSLGNKNSMDRFALILLHMRENLKDYFTIHDLAANMALRSKSPLRVISAGLDTLLQTDEGLMQLNSYLARFEVRLEWGWLRNEQVLGDRRTRNETEGAKVFRLVADEPRTGNEFSHLRHLGQKGERVESYCIWPHEQSMPVIVEAERTAISDTKEDTPTSHRKSSSKEQESRDWRDQFQELAMEEIAKLDSDGLLIKDTTIDQARIRIMASSRVLGTDTNLERVADANLIRHQQLEFSAAEIVMLSIFNSTTKYLGTKDRRTEAMRIIEELLQEFFESKGKKG